MPPLFKVIIHQQPPENQSEKAVMVLADSAAVSPSEAFSWLQQLPHTVTSRASETKARKLVEDLTALGVTVETIPELPKAPDSISTHVSREPFVLGTAQKQKSTSLMMSLIAMLGIALIFGLSLFIVYRLIERNVSADESYKSESYLKTNTEAPTKQKITRSTNKKMGEHALKRAILRIHQIRKKGAEKGWKNHLVSQNWDSDLNNLPNYYHHKMGDSALVDLKKALRQIPGNEEVYKWMGILYMERRQYKKAQKIFLHAARRWPGNVQFINYYGSALIEQKAYAKADSVLHTAIKLEPEHPSSLKNMGSLQLYFRKDTIRALRYYHRYMKLESANDFERPVIREQVTRILWEKYFPTDFSDRFKAYPFNQFEALRKKVMKQIREAPSASAYWRCGQLFAGRLMYREAMIQWLNGLRLNPAHSAMATDLYLLQGSKQLYSEAWGTLKSAADQLSVFPEMHFALGMLNKYYTEDHKSAIKNFRQYLDTGQKRYLDQAKLELEELLGF